MKCDDDSFINVPNLIHTLLGGTVPLYSSTSKFFSKSFPLKNESRVENSDYLIMGRYIGHSVVNRNPKLPWYVPRYMMSNDIFPDYVSGIGYVLAYESVRALYEQSLRTPILYLEDAYMTGVVAELAGIKRTRHPLFFWSQKDKCAMRGMIVLHHFRPLAAIRTFKFIINPLKKC
jgi:beta-1,3-galactosyltransferase 1